VMPDGACKACCVAQDAIHEGRRPLNVAEKSLEEIRGSGYMRSLRRALASGERAAVCSYCWDQEKRGETSLRQGWNLRHAGAAAQVSERTSRGVDLAEPLPLEYLQLSLGNKCNLACRMCNGSYSSRIAEDPVHAKWAGRTDGRSSLLGAGGLLARWGGRKPAPRADWAPGLPWFEQEEFFRAELLEGGSALRFLYVTGGEPFLNESFGRLIAEYVRRGWARNLSLMISTNLFHNEATIRRTMATLLPFAQCTVGASIDGYGAVYEYIRYPARWDIVERNIRVVRSIAEANPNLVLTLATAVQPYNCLGLVDLLRFADGLEISCYPHVIDGPDFLRMRVVPRALRQEAAARLHAYAGSPGASTAQAANREHALRLARHLESLEDDGRTARERRRFVEFTRALDESRGQQLSSSVPELSASFL
jgi:pyruvate-formate lyase-activating enzyme